MPAARDTAKVDTSFITERYVKQQLLGKTREAPGKSSNAVASTKLCKLSQTWLLYSRGLPNFTPLLLLPASCLQSFSLKSFQLHIWSSHAWTHPTYPFPALETAFFHDLGFHIWDVDLQLDKFVFFPTLHFDTTHILPWISRSNSTGRLESDP